ncbi:aminopeptidase N C-terminal domain-containing protein, partial [Klebsiella pneumoniae]|uniref:aminopeptidase N C-terminal domain-containing protein n=1 Tax=Klebsiella pneumoniae TaxID=573 RepID=UPI0025A21298
AFAEPTLGDKLVATQYHQADNMTDALAALSAAVAAELPCRDAQSVLQSATADMTRGNGEGITYGEVYHYKLRHRERGDKID